MIRSTPSWSTFAERLPWWAGSVTTVSKAQQREPRSAENYRGQGNLWVFNNVHRYFLYGSIVVVTFLWLEAIRAFFPAGFGLTIGSLVLLLNVVLLSGYTFGCHSMRHLVGARVDCYSCLRGGQRTPQGPPLGQRPDRTPYVLGLGQPVLGLGADVYVRLLMSGAPNLRVV